MEAEGARATLVFPSPDTLRMRLEGAALRFSLALPPRVFAYESAVPLGNGRWRVSIWPHVHSYLFSSPTGNLAVTAPWKGTKCDGITAEFGPGEGTIEEFQSAPPREPSVQFDAGAAAVEEEFGRWLAHAPEAPEKYSGARELASYINWASVVAAAGILRRPAMYMSKNWMTNIWSWDHCFNALALAKGEPDLAWDQLMVLFDFQDAAGALPDQVNDRSMLWNFVKPPVHGWTLRKMLERNEPAFAGRLKEAYDPLVRWTRWWLENRDSDGDGIPEYHHGNDSGWDNATVFRDGVPVEGADLASYLVIQMEVLADIAERLGKVPESEKWWEESRALLGRFVGHSWKGDRFASPLSGSHRAADGDSLINFMPLLLGHRLDGKVLNALLKGLGVEGRFLTEHGAATESARSPYYEADGYWLGPIWAPPTLFLVDALRDCEEAELARRLSAGFCDLCAREGMAENFDALTGKGLRDRAYTWTSSVFLLLAEGLGEE